MKTLVIILFALFAVSTVQGQEPQPDPLLQQKECADQAKKVFESKTSKNSEMFGEFSSSYTSHYDAKANTCYMAVHTKHFGADFELLSESTEITDAFEGRRYASYVWMSLPANVHLAEPCIIKPRGQDEIICKSSEEFRRLVDKHFGIGF